MREQLRTRGLWAIEPPSGRGRPIVVALAYFEFSNPVFGSHPFAWEQFSLLRVDRLTTKERTMASQNECPTIEEMISDEVRRRFGTRAFQAYEKRPETEKGRGYLRFLKLPVISRPGTYPHVAR